MKTEVSLFIYFALCGITLHSACGGQTTFATNGENLLHMEVLYRISDPNFPESGLNTPNVGENVCHLGDINGDGFDDWAVGLRAAVDYLTGLQTGTVHIHFGGEIPESESPPDLIIGGEANHIGFGAKIAAAGDVNGDGYDDLLVKFTEHDGFYTNTVPKVALYYGGDPFDAVADLTFAAAEGHYYFNFGTLAGAGDVNNDGYDDIVIGAPTKIGGPDTAHAYLFYGGDPMNPGIDLVFTGGFTPGGPPLGGAHSFALSLSGAGDMNQDGCDDVLIASGGGGTLYLGGATMDHTADLLFDDMTGMGTGPVVSGAGDVNNDGFDDALFGAWYSGRAYICFGGETIDNTSDVVISGWADWDYFGRSVSGAGDLNGDGFDDVVVGSDYGEGFGRVSVYLGGSSMNSIPDQIMQGEVYGDRFGYTVSGGGDLDGDGYNDIIVGAFGDYTSFSQDDDHGYISLFYGTDTLDNLPVAEAVFTGISTLPYFGQRAAHAGDVNSDGYPDIVVGDPYISSVLVYTNSSLLPSIGVEELLPGPGETALLKNYPNPFDAVTVIIYHLPATAHVDLSIYNMLGQKVETVVYENQQAGNHSVSWDASSFTNGIYFCRLHTGESQQTGKMMLVK